MEPQELKIEMTAEDLADFRNYLLERGGDELEPQELHEVSAGFHREPILIALVVVLGGPVITKEFVSLAKEWLRLRQQERIKLDFRTFTDVQGRLRRKCLVLKLRPDLPTCAAPKFRRTPVCSLTIL